MRFREKVFWLGLLMLFSWCLCDVPAQSLPPDNVQSASLPCRVVYTARHYDVDVLLLRYFGDGEEAMQDSEELLRKMKQVTGCDRVVVYPDSYVPVLISKDRMAEVQQLLGSQMLPLTSNLEWDP